MGFHDHRRPSQEQDKKGETSAQPWAKRGVPTLLVLLDNAGYHSLGTHIEPRAIKAAMEATMRTRFSAVAVLFPEHPPDVKAPYLVLYHNHLAPIPLDIACVAEVTEFQYRQDEIGGWVKLTTGEQEQ
jgi:hypothetical protein